MLKRSFARGLLLGGGALWFVRWVSSPTPGADAPVEAAPVALDVLDDDDPPPAAVAPVHRRSLKRRFATTLALTTIFFAGAALAAGAGNELAQVSPDSTVADAPATVTVTTTDAATPTTATDDTTTTDAATSATDSAAVPAPQAAAAAAADVTTPAATPTTTEPVTTDAPTTDATTTTTAATTVAAVAPADPTTTTDPSDVVVKPVVPVHAVQPADTHRRVSVATAHVHRSRSVQSSLPLPVPLAIPYHAIAFDPQEWLTENPGTPTGIAAVDIAMNYLGVPYVWGGSAPATGFDCSGLTRFVYGQLGISLTHYAAAQFAAFPKLDPGDLQPGDLLFFEPKADGPGHVGIYIGSDEMIEAPHTGAVVRITTVSGAAAALGFLGAVRPYDAHTATLLAATTPVVWGASTMTRLD
ncbi:MAG TPA: C40 family peptidase [Gaiellaceae bacterium]|nr:C40 family peptidase [Gaiellaceae bacterium]